MILLMSVNPSIRMVRDFLWPIIEYWASISMDAAAIVRPLSSRISVDTSSESSRSRSRSRKPVETVEPQRILT